MASNDVKLIQSLCRKYVNKQVKNHFADVTGEDDNSLSRGISRQIVKRICLHKDKDNLLLTVVRLLFWWVEAKGLFDEYIYGIPSTDFEIKYTYYPQIKLHFKENRYESSTNSRRPIRSEVSFRWRETTYSEAKVEALANKIVSDFVNPLLKYKRGRQCWTYWDDEKGYRFTVYVDSRDDAEKIIKQTINLQDEGEPDWSKHLREHKSEVDYSRRETVTVLGVTRQKPKRRPIGTVEFQYAELFIPGTSKPITLVDRTSYRPQALRYV